jgi:hypothetical protein
VDKDFMREGEPLFDWEKVVIEKRQDTIPDLPEATESPQDAPAALPKAPPESRGVLGLFQGLFQKRQSS